MIGFCISVIINLSPITMNSTGRYEVSWGSEYFDSMTYACSCQTLNLKQEEPGK